METGKEDPTIIKSDFDSGKANLEKAARNFESVQITVKDTKVLVAEKIAFYSAGIISLSITFVGYVLTEYKSAFLCKLFNIPLFHFLFASWIVFAIALLLGLLNRYLDGNYYFFQAATDWLSARLYLDKKKIDLLKSNYPIIFRSGEDRATMIESDSQVLSKNNELLKAKLVERDRYFIFAGWSFNVAMTSFLFGVILLVAFIIKILYCIICYLK